MKNLFKSLAAFVQEVPVIQKSSQAYNYKFADLPTIFEVINPIMQKHGLGFYQALTAEGLKTVVFHAESAEQIESVSPIPTNVTLKGQNDFQVAGSAITYFRRYALSAMLGLVTDVDVDAAGEQRTKPEKATKEAEQQQAVKKAANEVRANADGELMPTIEQKKNFLLLLNSPVLLDRERNAYITKVDKFTADRLVENTKKINEVIKERQKEKFLEVILKIDKAKTHTEANELASPLPIKTVVLSL